MIDFELFSKIKHYHEQKSLTPAQIARVLELGPRTVAKWLAEHRFLPRKAVKRSSKLDPFKSSILQMLETHPYSAVQIVQLFQGLLKVYPMILQGGHSISLFYGHLTPAMTQPVWRKHNPLPAGTVPKTTVVKRDQEGRPVLTFI